MRRFLMVAMQKLWLDPNEFDALAQRLDAEQQAARDRDEAILAAWAAEDATQRHAA